MQNSVSINLSEAIKSYQSGRSKHEPRAVFPAPLRHRFPGKRETDRSRHQENWNEIFSREGDWSRERRRGNSMGKKFRSLSTQLRRSRGAPVREMRKKRNMRRAERDGRARKSFTFRSSADSSPRVRYVPTKLLYRGRTVKYIRRKSGATNREGDHLDSLYGRKISQRSDVWRGQMMIDVNRKVKPFRCALYALKHQTGYYVSEGNIHCEKGSMTVPWLTLLELFDTWICDVKYMQRAQLWEYLMSFGRSWARNFKT